MDNTEQTEPVEKTEQTEITETTEQFEPTKPAEPVGTKSVEQTNNIKTFRDLLSDEYKDHKALKDYKDINSLVKSHLEAQKMIGKSDIPNEKSTVYDWNKFYNKIGRPDTPDKYDFKEVEKIEGFEINEQEVKEFKELAHKLGLTQKQADELRTSYINKALENHKQTYKSEAQIEKEFDEKGKKLFGNNFEAIINQTAQVLNENLSAEDVEKLKSLDNDNLLLISSLINNMTGKFLNEDNINGNYSGNKTGNELREELKQSIEKLDKMNLFDPERENLEKKVKALYGRGIKLYDN